MTSLFDGALLHRDSLGSVQRIEPSDVNWMIAGRGIVHSERTPPDERAGGARVMLAGGAPLDGERFIHWNFVSSSREKIERARQAWRQQTMGKVPGKTEWVPLPDR